MAAGLGESHDKKEENNTNQFIRHLKIFKNF